MTATGSREPRTAADPSECPICGDWRDSPTADCANCGWAIRPCGDVLGLCAYRGPHDGPHKITGSWKDRLAEAAAPAFGPPAEGAIQRRCWTISEATAVDDRDGVETGVTQCWLFHGHLGDHRFGQS